MLKFILCLLSIFIFALNARSSDENSRELVIKDKFGVIKIENRQVSKVTSSPYRFFVDIKCKGKKRKVQKVVDNWPNCGLLSFNWDEMSKNLEVTLGQSAYENSYRKCIKRDTRSLNLKEFCAASKTPPKELPEKVAKN